MQVLAGEKNDETERLARHWHGVQRYGFTFVDSGKVPKPWKVAAVYFYDPAVAKAILSSAHVGTQHAGLDDRAWSGRSVGNRALVPQPAARNR